MTERLPLEIFAIYFSGYSAHAIEYKGVVYPTLEHAYHCLRYTDPHIRKEILEARSPEKAWEVSQKYKSMQLRDFSERKLEVMEKLMRAKLAQHESIQKALRASGDMDIVKHITTGPPADGYWDDGTDGKGENHIGRIWMELRSELR
jgi:N-glycosidase YbiA